MQAIPGYPFFQGTDDLERSAVMCPDKGNDGEAAKRPCHKAQCRTNTHMYRSGKSGDLTGTAMARDFDKLTLFQDGLLVPDAVIHDIHDNLGSLRRRYDTVITYEVICCYRTPANSFSSQMDDLRYQSAELCQFGGLQKVADLSCFSVVRA